VRLDGLRVALGTMHGKDTAIAPALARLGITVIVPDDLDTDRFGTFTGEIPRAGEIEDAARAKARAAISATGLPIALASEGSYGPHPVIPFVPLGQELILWRDETLGYEVIERVFDETPCFDHVETATARDANAFLERIGFPETAIVAAPATQPTAPVAKGVRDPEALTSAIAQAVEASANGLALLQTDMRAHMNPRRMATIGRLAEALARRLATACPQCDAPGFGRMRTQPGLPCEACGLPTDLVAREIHGCGACGHSESRARSDGRTSASAATCPLCNP